MNQRKCHFTKGNAIPEDNDIIKDLSQLCKILYLKIQTFANIRKFFQVKIFPENWEVTFISKENLTKRT